MTVEIGRNTAPDIVAILQMPPPVNGLSAMNAAIAARLAAAGRLAATWNTAPSPGHKGPAAILDRTGRVAIAAVRLIFSRPRGCRILYMPCDGGAGLLFNIGLALIARLLGLVLWTHHHSFAYVDRRSPLFALFLKASPRQALHIGLCGDMLSRLKARYPTEWKAAEVHDHVLSNAFAVAAAQFEAPSACATRIRLGHLSNLTVDKGAVAFMDLIEAALARGLDVEGVLAGPMADPDVETAFAERSPRLSGRLTWTGPVYGEAKAALLTGLDAFVFPTRYANEAQPLVLLEALAAGAPIATTKRGCISCDHAESPGLTSAEDKFQAEALDWVQTALATPEQRRAIRSAAHARSMALRQEAEASLAALLSRS